jgi:hypothetical protein
LSDPADECKCADCKCREPQDITTLYQVRSIGGATNYQVDFVKDHLMSRHEQSPDPSCPYCAST